MFQLLLPDFGARFYYLWHVRFRSYVITFDIHPYTTYLKVTHIFEQKYKTIFQL